jgi:CAAX protease family protein
LGFIAVIWVRKIIVNAFFIEDVLRSFASLERVFLTSFIYAVLTVIAVTLFLRLSGEKYKDLGFCAPAIGRQLGFGVLFGVLIFAFDTFLSSPLIEALLPKTSAQGVDMSRLFANINLLPLWIVIALFKGAFSEELWRIFALTRFEKWLGKRGLILALITGSVVFGFGHYYQGLSGLVSIAIVGFLYALVYLRRRRALEAVFAHATFNMISIVLGYLMYRVK